MLTRRRKRVHTTSPLPKKKPPCSGLDPKKKKKEKKNPKDSHTPCQTLVVMEFVKLSRKRGFKICPGFPCSVEECSLAEVVGHRCIKSAARMSGAVVIFVDDVIVINGVS
ncbi:hypothetical protein L3Q82_001952 [Scortum barcoo]|uniref:Uncharacterized protein n=1 Tax=Scortum barcoo TaxID=214431 RepID=A0ACB8W1Q7_9TELE|nr:hypothetical protein L3Q82_001952 [Scortum barcoo]